MFYDRLARPFATALAVVVGFFALMSLHAVRWADFYIIDPATLHVFGWAMCITGFLFLSTCFLMQSIQGEYGHDPEGIRWLYCLFAVFPIIFGGMILGESFHAPLTGEETRKTFGCLAMGFGWMALTLLSYICVRTPIDAPVRTPC